MEVNIPQYYESSWSQEIMEERRSTSQGILLESGGFYNLETLDDVIDKLQHVVANFAIHDITYEGCPVIYYNEGFKELTGLKHEDIIGKNIFLNCSSNASLEIGRLLCNSIKERSPASAIIEGYLKKDGTTFDNFVHIYPLISNDRKKQYVMSQHIDISSTNINRLVHSEESFFESEGEHEVSVDIDTSSLYPPAFQSYLEWRNIKLVVEVKDEESKSIIPFRQKKKERTLIENISGFAMPGDMIVIMGPSGCGKTTLLNVLSGRKETGVTGEVLFNGKPRDKNFKRRVAYVLQDDVLFPILTVYQTLLDQARLRLPREMSLKKKKELVNRVIKALNLEKARNTFIGNQFIRGVSGGERKRVNIGCQLLSYPSIIFLDEPTSGLDTSTAYSLIKIMKNLAALGYTIISTIHQPSPQMFALFDKLILMLEGRIIYDGPANKSKEYFQSLGFEIPSASNPADHIMSLLLKEGKKSPESRTILQNKLIDSWVLSPTYQKKPDPVVAESIQKKYESMNLRQYPASYLEQAIVLGSRSLRMGAGTYFQPLPLFQTIFVALLSGLIWLNTPSSSVDARNGAIFFIVLFAGGFTPLLNVLYNFPLERPVIIRERSEGAYPLSAYFLAKVIGEAPFELIYPFLFLVISYWLIGLDPEFTSFLEVFVILMFLVWASSGLGLMIGSVVYNVKTASTLATIILLSLVLTAGFYVDIAFIPVWISWIRYVSYIKYAYDGLILVDLGGVADLSRFNIIVPHYGAIIGILIGFLIFFRVASFFLLKLFFKQKK